MYTPSDRRKHTPSISAYHADGKLYELSVSNYTCNKFGLAEFLAQNYARLALPPCITALDVGSGVGPLSLFLADAHELHVTAVEINPLAYQCCVDNIARYHAQDRITVLNIDFSEALSLLPSSTYDLIIANPPISPLDGKNNAISAARAKERQEMDSQLYAFQTNYWRDEQGLDLVDHIFQFADKRLNYDGHIILVCCDIELDCISYINKKEKKYHYYEITRIDCYISPQSIGVENFICNPIESHIFLLKKENRHEYRYC